MQILRMILDLLYLEQFKFGCTGQYRLLKPGGLRRWLTRPLPQAVLTSLPYPYTDA